MYKELVKALRETDFGYTCAYCEHSDMCKADDCIIVQAAVAIENLEMRLNKTGVFTADGTEILKGDKVNGLFLYSKPITGTVIFKDGSFGVEWDRGGSMEFTPFTSTCNVNWKIVKEVVE